MLKQLLKPMIIGGLLASHMAIANPLMDQSQFQTYVYDFLKKNYKDQQVAKSERIDLIRMGDQHFGLFILYDVYANGDGDKKALDKRLAAHFKGLIVEQTHKKIPDYKKWVDVKGLIRPQLAPIEYLKKADLAHHKLDEHVIATFVIDDESAYKYVTSDKLKEWEIDMDTLADAAYANLGSASMNIPMHISNKEEKFIAVQVMDGYDAARLMVPDFRAFVTQHLGDPFYAATPNRDFLIMWSGENSENFKSAVLENIKKDYKEKPHPLSPSTFEVSTNKVKAIK